MSDPIGYVLRSDLPVTPWSTVFVGPEMDDAVPVFAQGLLAENARLREALASIANADQMRPSEMAERAQAALAEGSDGEAS